MAMKSEVSQSKFVLCIRNDGSDDLEPRKLYQVLPDRAAAQTGYIRIIDESGEDYLYPADYFVALRLPAVAKERLVSPPKNTPSPRRKSRVRAIRS
jgi:hypothetical protein